MQRHCYVYVSLRKKSRDFFIVITRTLQWKKFHCQGSLANISLHRHWLITLRRVCSSNHEKKFFSQETPPGIKIGREKNMIFDLKIICFQLPFRSTTNCLLTMHSKWYRLFLELKIYFQRIISNNFKVEIEKRIWLSAKYIENSTNRQIDETKMSVSNAEKELGSFAEKQATRYNVTKHKCYGYNKTG